MIEAGWRKANGVCPVCHWTMWFTPTTAGGDCWPIDKVVSWAKTEHGGRQMMLLDAAMESSEDAGCMRWGLCEPPSGREEEQ